MLLYRTPAGPVLHEGGKWFRIDRAWDALVNDDQLAGFLRTQISALPGDAALAEAVKRPLAPLGDMQEVWAAGVTYLRSRTARMEESQSAGGGDFYDRVYRAERPEIFFKATPHRVAAPGAA